MNQLFPIMAIKKRFLKTLFEELSKGNIYSFPKVLQLSHKKYEKSNFTKDVLEAGNIAVQELERDGYIEKIRNKENSYKLTRKGTKVASKKIDDMKLPYTDLSRLGLHIGLFIKIYDDIKYIIY